MQTANIDISQNGTLNVFQAMQGDTDRQIQVSLFDAGSPYDVSSAAVSVWYDNFAGNAGNFSDGISVSGNSITITLNGNLTAVTGNYGIVIMLNETSGKISSWNIGLIVGAVPGYGSAAAGEYFDAFQAGYLAAQINTLNARVSTIIANGTPTDGNTELIDIRTAWNGQVYPTAGDAVRGQIENLHNEASQVYTLNPGLVNFSELSFFVRNNFKIQLVRKSESSFTIQNNDPQSVLMFSGFVVTVDPGTSYDLYYSFDPSSTFPDSPPISTIFGVTDTDDMGEPVLASAPVGQLSGVLTFTPSASQVSIRTVSVTGNQQTVTCYLYEHGENAVSFSQASQEQIKQIVAPMIPVIPALPSDSHIEDLATGVLKNSRKWNGKTWLAYGDSITAISNGDYLDHGWAQYVNNLLGFGAFHGRGVGGQTYAWNSVTFQVDPTTGNYVGRGTASDNCLGCFPSWQRISSMIPDSIKDSIDLIWLMGGTNDIHNVEESTGQSAIVYEKPVFSADNTTDQQWAAAPEYLGGDYDVTTFSGAVASTVMKLQVRCPNAIIILAAPMPRWFTNTFHPSNPSIQTETYQNGEYNGKTTADMAVILEQIANYMSVPYFNTQRECMINGFNWSTYMDGVHPYPAPGQKMLGRTVAGAIDQIYPIID